MQNVTVQMDIYVNFTKQKVDAKYTLQLHIQLHTHIYCISFYFTNMILGILHCIALHSNVHTAKVKNGTKSLYFNLQRDINVTVLFFTVTMCTYT